ncbi:MAG: tetratricopeptide repeat protein [Treponema sp.]|jgi:tetratricopeptide (TPR) repeat protein|nr:tetratricopeptide repeat protein [Treponema sp.]
MADKTGFSTPAGEAQVYSLEPRYKNPDSSKPVKNPDPPAEPQDGSPRPAGSKPDAGAARGGGRLPEGIRLFRMKRYDMALKELSQVDGSGFSAEENAELSYYLGLCHTKLAHYEDALLYLDQVISTGQNVLRSYQCRMMLAYIYMVTRKTKMAEFELTRLQKSGFESVQLYTTLAYASWAQQNVKAAVAYYERALDMDGNNTTALNGLGYILVETNSDLIRGLRLCRRAVDKKPQNAAYLDSLGWAYFKTGEVLAARTWLRRAIDLAPREKEIRDHWRIMTGEEPPRGK